VVISHKKYRRPASSPANSLVNTTWKKKRASQHAVNAPERRIRPGTEPLDQTFFSVNQLARLHHISDRSRQRGIPPQNRRGTSASGDQKSIPRVRTVDVGVYWRFCRLAPHAQGDKKGEKQGCTVHPGAMKTRKDQRWERGLKGGGRPPFSFEIFYVAREPQVLSERGVWKRLSVENPCLLL